MFLPFADFVVDPIIAQLTELVKGFCLDVIIGAQPADGFAVNSALFAQRISASKAPQKSTAERRCFFVVLQRGLEPRNCGAGAEFHLSAALKKCYAFWCPWVRANCKTQKNSTAV